MNSAAGEKTFHIPPETRKGMAQFVVKLVTLLETSDPRLVRWNHDGTSFLVFTPQRFASEVLAKHFKSSLFSSFIRQLNFYSFHKVQTGSQTGTWEFKHEKFLRGRLDLMRGIKRKTSSEYHVAYDQELKKLNKVIADLRSSVGSLQEQLVSAAATIEALQAEKQEALAEAHAARKSLGLTEADPSIVHGGRFAPPRAASVAPAPRVAAEAFREAAKTERPAKRRRVAVTCGATKLGGCESGAGAMSAPANAATSGSAAAAAAAAAARDEAAQVAAAVSPPGPHSRPEEDDVEVPPFSFEDPATKSTLPGDLFDSLLNMELVDDSPTRVPLGDLDLSWLTPSGAGAGAGAGAGSAADALMSPVLLRRSLSSATDVSMGNNAAGPEALGSMLPPAPPAAPMADVRARVCELPTEEQQKMAVHLYRLLKEREASVTPRVLAPATPLPMAAPPSVAAEQLERQVPPQQLYEVLMQLPAAAAAVMTAATAAGAALHLAGPAVLAQAARS